MIFDIITVADVWLTDGTDPTTEDGAVGMAVSKISHRPFGLGDLLIMIAGLAALFALIRMNIEFYWKLGWAELWVIPPGKSWTAVASTLITLIIQLAPVAAFVGTVTVLMMRLKGPRPLVVRLARQPGFMACAVVLLTLVAGTVPLAVYNFIARPIDDVSPLFNTATLVMGLLFVMMPVPVGLSVSASWFTLVLNRRWRPEPTWLDRAGRFFGVLWMLLALAKTSYFFFFLGLALS